MANSDQTIGQVEAMSAAVEALRKAQEDLTKSTRRANSVLSQQADLASQMSNATDTSGLDRLEQSLNSSEAAMRSASGAANDAQDRLGGLEKQVNDLTTAEERNAARIKSFVAGIKRAGAGLKLLAGFLGSAISGMFSLGKAIFMLPFRLLSGLVSFAADGGGGNELRQAYEEVRKTFGDLASGPARDLIDSFQSVRAESGSLAGSGISLRRVFGAGPGGLAAAMNFIREQAEGLGAQFQLLRGEFLESAADLIVFQKGLGLSTEQFKAFTTLAIGSGGDLTDTLGEVANLSIQLGDRFNLSAKQIAQGMATLASDFVSFGHMTQEELAATTVYAMELGVEIEALTKVAEKFSTFESAAESASKLNQALGLQLDTMALLTAESPADQLKQIQDAFFATGRSVTDLNRAERELLATQLGLSGADLAAALSPENAGKSLEEIQAAAAGAADAPLTAEESMNRLADSIERVFESGGGMKSFFQAFAEGFEQGLRWSGPTRELFRNIRQSLRVTRQAGRDFARMFVENFPGVTEVVEGLRDAFDPEKFRRFLTAVTGAFREFFTTMDPDNPSGSVGAFLEKIQDAFGVTFGGDEGGGILQKLKDGFNKIATFLVNAFAGLVPHVVDGMVSLMTTLTDVLNGKEGAGPNIQSGDFISEELATALNNAFETLGNELPRLVEPLGNLLSALWDALEKSGVLEPALKAFGTYVIVTAFGPAVILGAIKLIAKGFWAGIKRLFTGRPAAEAAEAGGRSFMSRFASAFRRFANRYLPTFTRFFGRITAAAGRMASRAGGVFSRLGRFMRPLGTLFRGVGAVFSRTIGIIVGVVIIGIDTFRRFKSTVEEFGDGMSSVGALLGSLVASVANFLALGFLSEDDQRYIVILTNDLVESVKEKWNQFKDFFANLWDTVKTGVREGFTGIKDAVMSLGGDIIDSFKLMFGIRSPSTVFMDIGRNLIQGLVDGVLSMASRPVEAIRELGGMAIQGIRNIFPGGGSEGGAEGALGAAAQMFTAPLQMLQGQVETVVTAVRVVAQGVEEFRAMMNNLDDIDVIAELQQIGRTLGVDNGTVTVNTEPLNLTVNFQIRMDAEKVAAVLTGEPQTVVPLTGDNRLARVGSIG